MLNKDKTCTQARNTRKMQKKTRAQAPRAHRYNLPIYSGYQLAISQFSSGLRILRLSVEFEHRRELNYITSDQTNHLNIEKLKIDQSNIDYLFGFLIN